MEEGKNEIEMEKDTKRRGRETREVIGKETERREEKDKKK